MRRQVLLCGCALMLAAGLFAGEESASQEKLKALIAALSSETFDLREQAVAELVALGETARAALDAAAIGSDGDLRSRAREVLAKIELARTRIVYAYFGELRIAPHDLSEFRTLLKNDVGSGSAPRLSPDGAAVIFCQGHPSAIHTIDCDGGNLKRLSPEKIRRMETRPCFSPDGNRILFTSSDTDVSGPDEHQLWEMDRDGGNRRMLCNDASDGVYLPDGRIVCQTFVRQSRQEKRADGVYTLTSRDSRISVLSADGKHRQVLTKEDLHLPERPQPSPDGKTIVFAHSGDIWLMDVDGGNQRKIFSGYSWNPCFSPDGNRIVFSEYGESHLPRDQLKVLWSIGLDGGPRRKLGAGDQPHWGKCSPRLGK